MKVRPTVTETSFFPSSWAVEKLTAARSSKAATIGLRIFPPTPKRARGKLARDRAAADWLDWCGRLTQGRGSQGANLNGGEWFKIETMANALDFGPYVDIENGKR